MRRLAVLEAEWAPKYNSSVKPFIEGLAQHFGDRGNPTDFYYERFVGAQSFEETLTFLVRKRDVRNLYIATHGLLTNIDCPNGESVTREDLAHILSFALENTQLDGLLLGSCLIGSPGTAELLMPSRSMAGEKRVKWVAGYESRADWFKSTLIDTFFLHLVLEATLYRALGRALQSAVAELNRGMSGMIEETKFRVFVRQKRSGQIVDLLESLRADVDLDIADE